MKSFDYLPKYLKNQLLKSIAGSNPSGSGIGLRTLERILSIETLTEQEISSLTLIGSLKHQLPFLTSPKTFGRIDALSVFNTSGQTAVFIRGWTYVPRKSIKRLTLRLSDSFQIQMRAFEPRDDVKALFFFDNHSLLSGFEGVFPVNQPLTIPDAVPCQVDFTTGESLTITLPVVSDFHPCPGVSLPKVSAENPTNEQVLASVIFDGRLEQNHAIQAAQDFVREGCNNSEVFVVLTEDASSSVSKLDHGIQLALRSRTLEPISLINSLLGEISGSMVVYAGSSIVVNNVAVNLARGILFQDEKVAGLCGPVFNSRGKLMTDSVENPQETGSPLPNKRCLCQHRYSKPAEEGPLPYFAIRPELLNGISNNLSPTDTTIQSALFYHPEFCGVLADSPADQFRAVFPSNLFSKRTPTICFFYDQLNNPRSGGITAGRIRLIEALVQSGYRVLLQTDERPANRLRNSCRIGLLPTDTCASHLLEIVANVDVVVLSTRVYRKTEAQYLEAFLRPNSKVWLLDRAVEETLDFAIPSFGWSFGRGSLQASDSTLLADDSLIKLRRRFENIISYAKHVSPCA